ncbi:type IV pilus modification protein PilV [Ideonella sp. DXS29W]|uniref:Type IV pilus modification protein PilV n=1 Tax=Ideonella lacteola TaxID=2984193 RepID=A0ABU9BHI0_9BURK
MRRITVRRVRGVSLIEVLVAMLVVSFGVLALSGLMAAASRLGKTSEFRAVATLLASDMADRMRANKLGVNNGAYELLNAYEPPSDEPPDPVACAKKTECSPAELAAQDLAEWNQALYHSLPSAQGYVAADGSQTPPVAADIWVAWLDPKASENEDAFGSDSGSHQECPPGFRDKDPQPRCLYFRVSL